MDKNTVFAQTDTICAFPTPFDLFFSPPLPRFFSHSAPVAPLPPPAILVVPSADLSLALKTCRESARTFEGESKGGCVCDRG